MIHATEIPLTGANLIQCFHSTLAVTLTTQHQMFILSNVTTETTNMQTPQTCNTLLCCSTNKHIITTDI